jgi:hypothetical protein
MPPANTPLQRKDCFELKTLKNKKQNKTKKPKLDSKIE